MRQRRVMLHVVIRRSGPRPMPTQDVPVITGNDRKESGNVHDAGNLTPSNTMRSLL